MAGYDYQDVVGLGVMTPRAARRMSAGLAARLTPRAYRFGTFAAADLGLLYRIVLSEKYLVPSRGARGVQASGVVLALHPTINDGRMCGVCQAIAAGSRHHLDQLARDASAVCSQEPIWRDSQADARAAFRSWEAVGTTAALARFAEAAAGRSLGDEMLMDGSSAQQTLVQRSREAHQRLLDLDELAMRCLLDGQQHDELELAGLRETRRQVRDEIQVVREEFLAVFGGVIPAIWPL